VIARSSPPRVGVACTAAAKERYCASASVRRLEQLAEVGWLLFDGPSRTEGPPPEEAELVSRLRRFAVDLDALVVSYGCPRVSAGVIAAAPRLALIGETHGDRRGERIDVAAARARQIVLVDTTNASSDPVAEWALALMLIGLRNAGALFRRLLAGEVLWEDREEFRSDPGYLNAELTGKTVGIVGAGHVGRLLIGYLRPFDVRILAHDPGAPDELGDIFDLELTSLENVMRHADVAVCLVPLTATTRGLIGTAEIEAIKPGGVFVNVSRGAVVDGEALLRRLRRGDLVACLDVVDPEPLEASSPLRALPNVFLSPHIAGVTAASEPRFFDRMVDELTRFFAGHRVRHPLVPRT